MDSLLPKVSIVTITWGHELFIEESLKSFFEQEYNGPIEIIIANDNSPDNSHQIIQSFINRTNIPSNIEIKYTKHSKNKGMMGNFVWAIEEATGKYIALCEGDDYWIDKEKIKKQVLFLEENPEYVINFNQVNIMDNQTKNIKKSHPNINESKPINQIELAKKNIITTPTCMFRNQFKKLPDWFLECSIGDYPLYLYLTNFGKAYFTSYPSAIYRDEVGTFSTLSNYKRELNTKNTLEILINKGDFKEDVINVIKKQINLFYFYIFTNSTDNNKYLNLLLGKVDFDNLPFKTRIKILIKSLLK